MMLHITINVVAIRGGATPLIVAISGWSGGFGRASALSFRVLAR